MKINLQTLTHTIAHAAPLLGNALAGPGGAAVGQVIAAKFGGDSERPEALHVLIQNDPHAHSKLKQIESDHEVELQRLALQAASQQLQESFQDRSPGEQREVVATTTPAAQRGQVPTVLAYLLTLGLFTVVLALLFVPLPNENAHAIWGLVSSLTTVWVGVMGYHHGTNISDTAFVHHLHYGPEVHAEEDPPPVPPKGSAPGKLSTG